jgi:hypothetical protein
VQPHQLARDRHRPLAALAAGAISVVLARNQLDPPFMRDDILVAQAERLADPHPGPEQQREQEPVPQPSLGGEHRRDLLERQRPREPPLFAQPAEPPARLGASDPLQEGLVAAAPRAARVDQDPRDLDAVAGVELVEAEHRRQHPVHGARAPPGLTRRQHDHVVRRPPQPTREQAHLLQRHPIPAQPPRLQEHPECLQILGVRAHRVRRTLNPRKPRQIALNRLDWPPITADEGPRLRPAAGRNNTLDPHPPPPRPRQHWWP